MIEFSQIVEVKLIDTTSTPITLHCDPFNFQPSQVDDDAGVAYICDTTFTVDKPSADVAKRLIMPQFATVTLTDSKNNRYEIGSSYVPARVSMAPHLSRAQLIVKCTMRRHPLAFPISQ